MDSYRVVFRGEVAPGFDTSDVKAAFANKFGITEAAKIDQLFSGKQVTLKKNIDHSSAQKLKEKLASIGAVSHARKMEASELGWLSFNEEQQAAASAPASSPDSSPAATAKEPPKADTPSGLSLVPMAEKEEEAADAGAPTDGPAAFQVRDPSPEPSAVAASRPAAQASAATPLSSNARIAAAELELDRNTSGDGSSAAPEGASGLCWGGFFLGWIWAVFNRSWLGLLGLVPFLSLPVAVLLLIKGRDWAWKNKRWRSVDHFNEVQRKWSIAGMIIAVVGSFLWLQLLRDVSEFTEAEAMQMEEQRQELRDQLESIEDPEQRRQMEALIKFQEELQKELEKSG